MAGCTKGQHHNRLYRKGTFSFSVTVKALLVSTCRFCRGSTGARNRLDSPRLIPNDFNTFKDGFAQPAKICFFYLVAHTHSARARVVFMNQMVRFF